MVWAVQPSFNPSMHITPHNRQTSCVDNSNRSSTCRLTIHKYSNSCQTTVQFKPFCFRHWLFIWVLPGNSYLANILNPRLRDMKSIKIWIEQSRLPSYLGREFLSFCKPCMLYYGSNTGMSSHGFCLLGHPKFKDSNSSTTG
jgi:hypothetical protein